jgi:hypothetical protein
LAVAHTAAAVEAGGGTGGDGDGPPWYGEREARPEYGETEPGRPVCRSDCYNQTLSMAYLQGVCLGDERDVAPNAITLQGNEAEKQTGGMGAHLNARCVNAGYLMKHKTTPEAAVSDCQQIFN